MSRAGRFADLLLRLREDCRMPILISENGARANELLPLEVHA